MGIASFVFYFFAALLIVSALMVISSRNSVHSVLFLIFAFFNAAGLFVLLGAEYIAMTLVIVYVGAVAVLFLFVVMMIDIDIAAMRQGFLKYLPTGGLAALFLMLQFYLLFQATRVSQPVTVSSKIPTPDVTEVTNTEALGQVLYTDYIYPFQLAGVILLVAMIGAIFLTLRNRKSALRQNIHAQLSRKREDSITMVSSLREDTTEGAS